MDRLFLDANVLFSAAYRESSGLLRFWELDDAELLTSLYAIEEARRNLDAEDPRRRLDGLLRGVRVVPESVCELPSEGKLSDKDVPILRAAIAARASHLVTGDRRDFGRYFGKTVGGVRVTTPRAFWTSRNPGG